MSLSAFTMRLTTRIIRLLLPALFVCCWTSQVKPQTIDKPAGSTVSGIIVYSDTGHPVRHARVTLFSEERQWRLETLSDLRGRFEFEPVIAGRYFVMVEAPGLLSPYLTAVRTQGVVPRPRYPDVSDVMTRVTVNGRDALELKIKAVRGGVITGKVLGEDDQPVPEAEIRLLRREDGKWVPLKISWSDGDGQPQRADVTGVYRIAGLPSGDYLVRASQPSTPDDNMPGEEDAYSNGGFMIAYYPAATRLKDAQAVSVVAGSESTGIDIRLPQQESHTITGTVAFALNKKPVSYIEIIVERSDEVGFGKLINTSIAKTDNEGKWQVSGLPSGEYLVTIDGGGLDLAEDGSAGFVHALPKRITVRVRDEKVIVLNTKLTLGAQVVGTVKLIGAPPDREWFVHVGALPAPNVSGANSAKDTSDYRLFPIQFTNGGGKFAITGLEAGTYWLTVNGATNSEFYVKAATRKGVDLMQTPIKLTDEFVFEDVVVTIATDLASVEGQVVMPEATAEQQSGGYARVLIAPADEATLRFSSGTRTVQADANGKVVFRSAPGEYFIAALSADNYLAVESQISNEFFQKNAEKFLRIKLRAGEQVKNLRVPFIKK